jgi:hypothetical protein
MMLGIRRLVVCTAVTGLLTAGAVGMSMETAHADNIATACGANTANDFLCSLDATITSPGSISVSVNSGEVNMEVNVNWTVTCTEGNSSQSQEGATDDAETPLTVPLSPLPPTAGGSCNVNAGVSIPKPDPTAPIDYSGELLYTPASSTSTSTASVHPIKGFGGKCVDDKGNSSANRAEVLIWGCSSTDQAENWTFSDNELKHNSMCLDDKANGGSGSKVILYTCSGASNQKWSELANGELKLQAHDGKYCLDDPRSSTTNGTQLIIYSCKDSSNQKWSLP